MTEEAAPIRPRGTPPSAKELAKELGPRAPLWDAVVSMVKEFDAIWKWAHSETTWTWGYRAYLPGERFFVGLSMQGDGLEASLNIKTEEWDTIVGDGQAERDALAVLQERALATGEDPAWLHVSLTSDAELPVLAKLLFARGRRVQQPRRSKRRK